MAVRVSADCENRSVVDHIGLGILINAGDACIGWIGFDSEQDLFDIIPWSEAETIFDFKALGDFQK